MTQTWFDAMEAQAQVDLARQTVDSYARAVQVVEKRFARGLSTGLDLRLIISNLEASRASLSSRKINWVNRNGGLRFWPVVIRQQK